MQIKNPTKIPEIAPISEPLFQKKLQKRQEPIEQQLQTKSNLQIPRKIHDKEAIIKKGNIIKLKIPIRRIFTILCYCSDCLFVTNLKIYGINKLLLNILDKLMDLKPQS
jgi:hypothetical protein